MKVRKILSSLLAATMMTTYLLSFSTIANAENELNIKTTVVKLSDSEEDKKLFYNTYDFDLSVLNDSACVYKVTSTVSGVNAEVKVTTEGRNKYYNGKVVSGASLTYTLNPGCIYSDNEGDVLPAKSYNDSNELKLTANSTKEDEAVSLSFAGIIAGLADMPPYNTASSTKKDAIFDGFTVEGIIVTNTNSFSIDVAAAVSGSAISNGKITDNTYYNLTGSEAVTVKPDEISATAIKLDKESLEFDLNGTKTETLTATVEPENATDKTVTWSIAEEDKEYVEINTKDNTCSITALKVTPEDKTVTVTATAGKASASCKITVVDTTPKPDSESSQKEITKVDGKTLFKIGTIFNNAPATKRISVYSTSLKDTRESTKTIAELLNGEAKEGTIDVEITVGILTDRTNDVFTFGLVD